MMTGPARLNARRGFRMTDEPEQLAWQRLLPEPDAFDSGVINYVKHLQNKGLLVWLLFRERSRAASDAPRLVMTGSGLRSNDASGDGFARSRVATICLAGV